MISKLKMFFFTIFVSSSIFAQGFTSNTSTGNTALAQPGFSGPVYGITTVKQVNDSGMFNDDMPVTLTGRIKASLGGEMYLFTDSTGEVTIEIDHDKWFGRTVTPATIIQIRGEIDRNVFGIKVDVDDIRLQ
ncbi:hypothetical protein BCU78_01980 [Vibrio lentus]|nr:NirD/YgiW/YdeI family stress tolerance protein [Vibrio lentus]PMH03990.1 hypothetical protein BCU78_01980 [Vibrio lentus]